MDRFVLCEVGYPTPLIEQHILERSAPALPTELRELMVKFANEVREKFMGEGEGAIEVTFSTRSLIRWADLTLRFQPVARQGLQPVMYALDRAWPSGPAARHAPCCMSWRNGISLWRLIWGSRWERESG